MALTTCKECNAEVSEKASSCPKCGYDFGKVEEEQNMIIGFILMIVLVVGGWMWISSDSSVETQTQTEWHQEDASIMAYVKVETWVKEELISPGSAKFPSIFDGQQGNVKRNGQVYTINSWVDSHNPAGALIRTRFTAEVEQVADDNWRLNKLEFH